MKIVLIYAGQMPGESELNKKPFWVNGKVVYVRIALAESDNLVDALEESNPREGEVLLNTFSVK